MMKLSFLSEHCVASSEHCLPCLKYLLRKIIYNLESYENNIILIFERLV